MRRFGVSRYESILSIWKSLTVTICCARKRWLCSETYLHKNMSLHQNGHCVGPCSLPILRSAIGRVLIGFIISRRTPPDLSYTLSIEKASQLNNAKSEMYEVLNSNWAFLNTGSKAQQPIAVSGVGLTPQWRSLDRAISFTLAFIQPACRPFFFAFYRFYNVPTLYFPTKDTT